jgi:hypothetical protein
MHASVCPYSAIPKLRDPVELPDLGQMVQGCGFVVAPIQIRCRNTGLESPIHAVLDVFDREPLPESSPLWDLPGVYISAHSSVSVDRYMDDVFALVYENLKRYLAGETLHNVIELDAP